MTSFLPAKFISILTHQFNITEILFAIKYSIPVEEMDAKIIFLVFSALAAVCYAYPVAEEKDLQPAASGLSVVGWGGLGWAGKGYGWPGARVVVPATTIVKTVPTWGGLGHGVVLGGHGVWGGHGGWY